MQFLEKRRSTNAFDRALDAAPDDDEQETTAEVTAIAEAYADFAAGRVISHEEALGRLSDGG